MSTKCIVDVCSMKQQTFFQQRMIKDVRILLRYYAKFYNSSERNFSKIKSFLL